MERGRCLGEGAAHGLRRDGSTPEHCWASAGGASRSARRGTAERKGGVSHRSEPGDRQQANRAACGASLSPHGFGEVARCETPAPTLGQMDSVTWESAVVTAAISAIVGAVVSLLAVSQVTVRQRRAERRDDARIELRATVQPLRANVRRYQAGVNPGMRRDNNVQIHADDYVLASRLLTTAGRLGALASMARKATSTPHRRYVRLGSGRRVPRRNGEWSRGSRPSLRATDARKLRRRLQSKHARLAARGTDDRSRIA